MKENTLRHVVNKPAHHVSNRELFLTIWKRTPERFDRVSIDKNLQKEYPPTLKKINPDKHT